MVRGIDCYEVRLLKSWSILGMVPDVGEGVAAIEHAKVAVGCAVIEIPVRG